MPVPVGDCYLATQNSSSKVEVKVNEGEDHGSGQIVVHYCEREAHYLKLGM